MDYFANADFVVTMKRPLFTIFDGDTRDERVRAIKEKLVSQLHIEPSRIITLSGDSIEAYLLKPRIIKAAFSSISSSEKAIESYILRFDRKRDKKEVLDGLLKRFAARKYDARAAAKMAREMKKEEIDQEILIVFKSIEGSVHRLMHKIHKQDSIVESSLTPGLTGPKLPLSESTRSASGHASA